MCIWTITAIIPISQARTLNPFLPMSWIVSQVVHSSVICAIALPSAPERVMWGRGKCQWIARVGRFWAVTGNWSQVTLQDSRANSWLCGSIHVDTWHSERWCCFHQNHLWSRCPIFAKVENQETDRLTCQPTESRSVKEIGIQNTMYDVQCTVPLHLFSCDFATMISVKKRRDSLMTPPCGDNRRPSVTKTKGQWRQNSL